MNATNLKLFAIAWLIMWGLSYITTAVIAPNITEAEYGAYLYVFLGALILFTLGCYHIAYDTFGFWVVRFLLCFLGIFMVYGGIASWTGLTVWNVPFENKEIFQVSMAFADLISAAFMFLLAIEKKSFKP